MSTVEKRSISLPKKQAEYLDQLVASGAYGSISEAVRAGLRELKARDAEIERWLHEEVAPTYDRAMAHPEELIPIDEVKARLENFMVERGASKE
ncbi:MAG: type II toxin-antitoxin system ParD family antitoxin [Pseudomonadota bacterium]